MDNLKLCKWLSDEFGITDQQYDAYIHSFNKDVMSGSPVHDNCWQQRAEAAETKLAELGASVPVYQYESAIYNEENGGTDWYWDDCDKGFYDQYDPSRRRILFTRPAPAADLSEMCDRQYIAGLQAGFRLGDAGDNEGLRKATANYRKQIIDNRSATTPAADLAELVPDKRQEKESDYQNLRDEKRGYNACIDNILRNIEEAKK